MRIELDFESFVDNLEKKYNFEKNKDGKVLIKFEKLTIDELIEIVNRYFNDGIVDSGWVVYKIDDNNIVIESENLKNYYTLQQFRAAFI